MRAAEPAPDDDAGPLTRTLRRAGHALLRLPAPVAAGLAATWAALIFVLSSRSAPQPQHPSPLWEWLSNLAHAPLFGLLTLWVAALLLRDPGGGWPRLPSARGAAVLAVTLAYGVLDELHQSTVEGRDASVLDIVTDVVSGAVVLWIVASLGQRGLPERTLLARLGLGLVACAACAALAMAS